MTSTNLVGCSPLKTPGKSRRRILGPQESRQDIYQFKRLPFKRCMAPRAA
jgi:hypothetical protein